MARRRRAGGAGAGAPPCLPVLPAGPGLRLARRRRLSRQGGAAGRGRPVPVDLRGGGVYVGRPGLRAPAAVLDLPRPVRAVRQLSVQRLRRARGVERAGHPAGRSARHAVALADRRPRRRPALRLLGLGHRRPRPGPAGAALRAPRDCRHAGPGARVGSAGRGRVRAGRRGLRPGGAVPIDADLLRGRGGRRGGAARLAPDGRESRVIDIGSRTARGAGARRRFRGADPALQPGPVDPPRRADADREPRRHPGRVALPARRQPPRPAGLRAGGGRHPAGARHVTGKVHPGDARPGALAAAAHRRPLPPGRRLRRVGLVGGGVEGGGARVHRRAVALRDRPGAAGRRGGAQPAGGVAARRVGAAQPRTHRA